MGKLYKKYNELKKENNNSIYLFKNGIFYICLADDANKLNEVLGLKLTHFDENVSKCGFPASSLNNYLRKLDNNDISYKIIDNAFTAIESPKEYMNSLNVKKILSILQEIDIEDISPKMAYEILNDLKALSTF